MIKDKIVSCLALSIFCCHHIALSMHHHIVVEIKEDLQKIHDDIQEIAEMFSFSKSGELPAVTNNPYKHTPASVRVGATISDGERAYRQQRLPIVRAALSKLLKRDNLADENTPVISLCYSGGGDRAACIAAAVMRALQLEKVYKAITYEVGLSGSTWAMGAKNALGLTPEGLERHLEECFADPFCQLSHKDAILMTEMIAAKKAYNQSYTLGDIYGWLVGQRLLKETHDMHYYVSEQAKKIENGTIPYPIYTMVDGSGKAVENPSWYALTPHELENLAPDNIEYATHIPTWAMGRTFEDGESVPHPDHGDYPPEQRFPNLMGFCGSAFAASLYDGFQEIEESLSPAVAAILKKCIKPVEGTSLPFYGKIENYTKDMADQPFHERSSLKLKDAGLAFNLPFPPVSGLLSERLSDVLIFVDASAGQDLGDEFKKTVAFAHEHNVPFPPLTPDDF